MDEIYLSQMDLIQIYAQLLAGEQICTGINQTKLQPKLRNLHGHILKSEHDKRIYNGSTKAAIGMTKLQLAAQSRWWTNLNGRGLPRSTDMQDLIQSPMTELIDRWPCSTRLDLHDLIWSMTTHLAYWIWSATGLECGVGSLRETSDDGGEKRNPKHEALIPY